MIIFLCVTSFGLVKSYTMPRPVESASLFPSRSKFIAGGDDMWVRLFDFTTGDEIGELPMGSFCMLVGCKDLFDILDCLQRHITDADCLFQRNLLSLTCPMCHKLPST